MITLLLPPKKRTRMTGAFASFLALLALLTTSGHAVTVADLDTDNDGLADAWEIQHFGGLNHTDGEPTDDPDNDDKDNLHECNANTDPNDPGDCLVLVSSAFDPVTARVTWPTVFAKKYRLDVSEGLNTTFPIEGTPGNPLEFRGTGEELTADFSDTTNPMVFGAVTRHIWNGLGSIPADLDAHFTSLIAGDADGDGTEWHPKLETPTDDGEAYSAKISGFISVKPGQGGNYTFYVASRGPSKFTLYNDPTPSAVHATCRVDDPDLSTEKDWLADPVQKSIQVSLAPGVKYFFEALHVHDNGLDHFAVGWEKSTSPGIINVVPGDCLSPAEDFGSHNAGALFTGQKRKFVRVTAHGALSFNDFDADGDGIDDGTEIALKKFGFNPRQANGTGNGGGNDGDTLASLLEFNPALDKEEVAALAIDDEAVENSSPPLLAGDIVDIANLDGDDTSGTSEDTITIRLSRSKGLHPLTINYTIDTDGSGTNPAATPGVDYNATEGPGGPVADGTVTLPALASSVDIEVTVEKDAIHEYPETISCAVDTTADHDPAPGFEVATAEICDMPDDVNILFVGAYVDDFNASPGTNSTNGTVSGYLKGDKRLFIMRNDNFGNLSSPQTDTHFHKVVSGGAGPPIKDIAEDSEAILGRYLTFDWDLTDQAPVTPDPGPGIPSRQVVIDSLFNQNSQSKIYINLHTSDNGGGEAMAMLEVATGSVEEPDPPAAPPSPGDAGFPLLSGTDLEREIVRFLNQATFGAAWEDVQAIKTAIETERTTGGNPDYHRVEEFEKWIEEQCKMEQTWILDYTMAMDFMEFNLRGLWDDAEWNDWSNNANNPNNPGESDVEPVPTTWPTINRSLTNGPAPGMPNTHPHFWANQWYPEGRYPTDHSWINWMDDETSGEGSKTVRNLGNNGPNHNNRRAAHWMMMTNAKDQLRQKWGYAIQQIIVVADTLDAVEDRHYAAANYQDMLNYYGLPTDRDGNDTLDANEQVYFRNIIGWVNWNPVMGYWLSSIRNRAAYDIDNDNIIDVFPDENLAREDMQLFTIGLFNLWSDGSLQLQAGSDPNVPPGSSATYTNDDIQEFARVLTGQNSSREGNTSHGPTLSWNGQGIPEDPFQWGIETTGPFPDSGDVFDTDNTNGDSDANDGDDGILYNQGDSAFDEGNGYRWTGHEWNYPMRMIGRNSSGSAIYHDLGVKTIAGGRVIDNTGLLSDQVTPENSTDASMIAMGIEDIEDAMDWFGGKVDGNPGPDFTGANGNADSSHASTPPFISRRLIQRMVASNPSSDYLYRVSKAFKDSEGNMLEVCKAVLLDHEARALENITNTFGMKKPPLEAYVQVLRSFEAHSLLPVSEDPSLPPFSLPPYNGSWPTDDGNGYNPGTYPTTPFTDPHEVPFATEYGYPASQADNFRFNCHYPYPVTDDQLSMTPFRQETVFNYYLPDYTTGVVQSAALVSPELQLATESNVVLNHNYFWTITWTWNTNRTSKADGQDTRELGGSNRNQRFIFTGSDTGGDWDHHDRVRIDFVSWGEFVFSQAPFVANNIPASGGRSSASLEAEAVLDFIDHRLTGGAFKEKYPYDENDDDDPLKDGFSPREPNANDGNFNNDGTDGRNPREWIIHALVDAYGDATNVPNDRRDYFRLALYLFSQTPEFLVKK
ncbi:MAG: DUF1800 family protein [Verrucomicrobiota bacterium]